MQLPPILEIFVVWHPDDELGADVASVLMDHFHSTAFAGLAGGAIEVYVRSPGWDAKGGPPRPMPFMQDLPHGLPEPQMTAVIPILGTGLARAVSNDREPGWRSYLERIADAERRGTIGVYPLIDPDGRADGAQDVLGRSNLLPSVCAKQLGSLLCREVSQAITQKLAMDSKDPRRITVFISHTKHVSADEDEEDTALLGEVRNVINWTRLGAFFDAADIQSGADWKAVLEREASRHALLMVRTDRYAEREWTQREVMLAKEHDVPVVVLYALSGGEDRGSFLMDHVPAVPCSIRNPRAGIERALDRLVDECLKRALWQRQSVYLEENGFDWLPAHAPEPVTVTQWLRGKERPSADNPGLVIIHPDPPLGPREKDAVVDVCALAGYTGKVDILTPRTFAARAGRS